MVATVSTLAACGSVLAQAPIPMPRTQTIGQATVWRTSDNKNGGGSAVGPWKEVQVTNVFGFKKKPIVGSKVTIVPLDVDLAPFDLKIIRLTAQKTCYDSLPVWWEVDLEPVTARNVFEIAPTTNRSAEYPFDVAVIYPAVSRARQLARGRLTREMLPRGVAVSTVKAAIDLTNDQKPDVLIIEYCCGKPSQPPDACDYTCSKTFKKVGRAWTLIDTSGPC